MDNRSIRKSTFKGHIRFLIIAFAVIIVAALVTTAVCAREYTVPVYNIFNQLNVTGTEYTMSVFQTVTLLSDK